MTKRTKYTAITSDGREFSVVGTHVEAINYEYHVFDGDEEVMVVPKGMGFKLEHLDD